VSSPFQLLLHTRAGKKRTFSPFQANQDRALVREFAPGDTGQSEPAALVAVADGVSRCPDGGAVAQWILHEKLDREDLFFHSTMDPGGQLHSRLLEFHQEFLEHFREDVLMLGSGCTLAAALLYGSRGLALWSGDSPVYHLQARDGRYHAQDLIVADKDPYSGALTDCFSGMTPFCLRHRSIRLQPGDIVIAATDGIVVSGKKLADSITKLGFSEEWMESVCQDSYDTPRSDDLSIAAARWLGPSGKSSSP
jgi:serine/threonine protein phosphatase PrpC